MTHCTVGFFLRYVCMFNMMMFHMCNSNGKYWKEKLTIFFSRKELGTIVVLKAALKYFLIGPLFCL